MMLKLNQLRKSRSQTATRNCVLFFFLMLMVVSTMAACGGAVPAAPPTAAPAAPPTAAPAAPTAAPAATNPTAVGGGSSDGKKDPPCALQTDYVRSVAANRVVDATGTYTDVFVLKAGDKDNEGNVIVIDTVTITVPQQLKPEGKVVSVQELELGKLADLGRDQPGHPKPQATKEFSPTKLVAQFQVVWDDKVDQCLRKFKPAIQFQVAYTAADVKNEWSACWTKSEKKEDCAKLAFDDHKGRWVVFSPDTKKHGYHVIGDENGGNLIVDTFSDYGDPHIAK